jgi:hypothetical protein
MTHRAGTRTTLPGGSEDRGNAPERRGEAGERRVDPDQSRWTSGEPRPGRGSPQLSRIRSGRYDDLVNLVDLSRGPAPPRARFRAGPVPIGLPARARGETGEGPPGPPAPHNFLISKDLTVVNLVSTEVHHWSPRSAGTGECGDITQGNRPRVAGRLADFAARPPPVLQAAGGGGRASSRIPVGMRHDNDLEQSWGVGSLWVPVSTRPAEPEPGWRRASKSAAARPSAFYQVRRSVLMTAPLPARASQRDNACVDRIGHGRASVDDQRQVSVHIRWEGMNRLGGPMGGNRLGRNTQVFRCSVLAIISMWTLDQRVVGSSPLGCLAAFHFLRSSTSMGPSETQACRNSRSPGNSGQGTAGRD